MISVALQLAEARVKMAAWRKAHKELRGHKVCILTNAETGEEREFESLTACADWLGFNHPSALDYYLKKNRLIFGVYKIERV